MINKEDKENSKETKKIVFWVRQGLLLAPMYLHSYWKIRVT